MNGTRRLGASAGSGTGPAPTAARIWSGVAPSAAIALAAIPSGSLSRPSSKCSVPSLPPFETDASRRAATIELARPGSEPAEPGIAEVKVGHARHEALLRCLLGDAHGLADRAPGRTGPAGLIDEMADQLVSHLAEPLDGKHGVAEVGERTAIRMLRGNVRDEVVQPDWFISHASTLH